MKAAFPTLESLAERLSRDGGFADFVRGEAALIAWEPDGSRILGASPAAAGLAAMLAGPDGRITASLPARPRLAALGAGAAPRSGAHLERLRLDPARLAPPVTCACRLATLDDGREVLVTAIVGPAPGRGPAPAGAPAAEREADPADAPAVEREADPADAEILPDRPSRPQGTVRFVWQTDAQTRFVQVSPALAAVVGPAAADILGRSWAELSGRVVDDPDDLPGRLARRETFSGHTLFWALADGAGAVPVDVAGAPVLGPDRSLAGFRGFGLIRTDSVQPRTPAPDVQAAPAADERPGAALPSEDILALAPDEASSAPASETGDGDPTEAWFESIRDLVTETLSNAEAALRPEEAPAEPAPATDAAEGALADAPDTPEPDPAPEPAGPVPRLPEPAKPAPATTLSDEERNAFREIARALSARLDPEPPVEAPRPADGPPAAAPAPPPPAAPAALASELLDRIPIGLLVHRGEHVLFANRLLLDLVAYDDVGQIAAEGGLARLFRGSPSLLRSEAGGAPLALTTRRDESLAVEVRLGTLPWDGIPAGLMMVRPVPEADEAGRLRRADAELKLKDGRIGELEAILDTATDGVVVFDETGRILSLNRSAEALFGYDQREVVGDAITVLFAPESHIVALDYLDGLRAPGVASLFNDGREVLGRVRQGGAIPLFMTMGTVGNGPGRKFCAVLRDITAFKKAEGELVAAKRVAEEASAQKSDLLAKISHEIRTPLNAIIGFAEVMLEERFGPIGNERYKEYLKDVHASGAHVISLVNDLLDLAKIEAGRLDLAFTSVSLNGLVAATVTLLQPQAARDRIVMRTSFAQKLPPVVADERSIRQIVLNLVSNAIKFTDAGGQVIVSTALTDRGDVAFRVRDTGIGMSEEEIEAALEPFRQLATARRRGGTGLGLPLTKALVEANRGALQITSNPNEGTLVEVLFPPTRVLAE